MKTVVEQFIEDFEKGTGTNFPEVLKDGWRRMAIEEISTAWEDGYFAGLMDNINDPNGFIKEKYPESFGNVKEE